VSKEYFIVRAGRIVGPTGGMYDLEAAETVARNAARRHPGATYTVMHQVSRFQFPRGKTPAP
jgi:hypothetical protein